MGIGMGVWEYGGLGEKTKIKASASLLATSMIFRWLYASNGLLNFVLIYLGLEPQAWLLSEALALPS